MSKLPWDFPLWGPILSPVSALVSLSMKWRRRRLARASKHRFPVPVISVGNLTVGGCGKTPLVLKLLEILGTGVKSCVLSRGYGPLVPSSGLSDEGDMIQNRFPHAILVEGKNRVKAFEACGHNPELIILDDGAQHLQIARDLEILLFDCKELVGPRFCLPAGPWRESLGAALAAQILILSRTDEVTSDDLERALKILEGRFPQKILLQSQHVATFLIDSKGTLLPLKEIRNRRILAVSGIARPQSFLASLVRAGAEVVDHLAFSDHAQFDSQSVLKIEAKVDQLGIDCLVITEKDRGKLQPILTPKLLEQCYALRVELELGNGLQSLKEAVAGLFEPTSENNHA